MSIDALNNTLMPLQSVASAQEILASHLVHVYSPYPHRIICYRAYFNESPVEVVKEQDKEFNKQATDAIIPSMPGHVVQAFTLLKSSPEAQVCAMAPVNILHYSFGEINYSSPYRCHELFVTYVDLHTMLPSLLNFVRLIMYCVADDLMSYSICYNYKLRRNPLTYVCLLLLSGLQ